MAVTQEEETLLSAMREKRASMRKRDLVDGYNIAMQHGLVPTPHRRRPKTADENAAAVGDRRRSSTSTFFEPDMSCFPAPPTDSTSLRAVVSAASPLSGLGDGGRPRISVDDLDLRDEGVGGLMGAGPSSAQGSRSSYGASESTPSSKLSFAAEDLLPSPTTTHGLPRTPPGDEDGEDVVVGAFGEQLGLEMEGKGHVRSRSFGGGLVILEGPLEGGRDGGEWGVGSCL